MQPRKLKVGIAFFNYGSNGGIAAEHPDIRKWAVKAILAAKKDERIEDLYSTDFTDTPIIMTRNAAVEWAKQGELDVLVMVDSDQAPDLYPEGKPFFESSFDFLYNHYDKGPVAIVAPYCGPPSHPTQGGGEIVYVFRWVNRDSHHPDAQFKQARYEREEASVQTGFQECSSGPTGLCMIDMRCFDFLTPPYFYYEYRGDGVNCPACNQPKPGVRAEKSSTEDCVFFRDLSLNGILEHGYNPVFCNWDAWAGHWKPKCVGKPEMIKADQVASTLKNVVERGQRSGMTRTVIKRNPKLPVHPKDARGGDFDKVFAVDEPKAPRTRAQRLDDNMVAIMRPDDPRLEPQAKVGHQVAESNGNVYDTFDDFVNGKTIEPKENEFCSADKMDWKTPQEAMYKLNGGTIDTSRPAVILHPDDPRMADTLEVEDGKPNAFKETHNTDEADIKFLKEIVYARAMDACVEERTLRIVELGSWVGHSAIAMAEVAEQLCEFEIVCVDHFNGGNPIQRKVAKEFDAYAEFKKNTARFPQIASWRTDTLSGAKDWAANGAPIDLIFVDADHSYEGCLADITAWWPFLRHKGIMCGHDFNFCFPGVRRAVTECFGWEVVNQGNMWIAKKGLDQLLIQPKSVVPAIEARHERTREFTTQAEWLGEPSIFVTSDTRTFEGT